MKRFLTFVTSIAIVVLLLSFAFVGTASAHISTASTSHNTSISHSHTSHTGALQPDASGCNNAWFGPSFVNLGACIEEGSILCFCINSSGTALFRTSQLNVSSCSIDVYVDGTWVGGGDCTNGAKHNSQITVPTVNILDTGGDYNSEAVLDILASGAPGGEIFAVIDSPVIQGCACIKTNHTHMM